MSSVLISKVVAIPATVGLILTLTACRADQEPKAPETLQGHTEEVKHLSFSPDGKTLVSASDHDGIKLWDTATRKITATLKDEDPCLWASAAFSPDGKTLATGGWFNKLKLWDVATRKGRVVLDEHHQAPPPIVAFSPDGKIVASGGACNPDFGLWDVAAGKRIATLKGYSLYGVLAMRFAPDSKTLVSLGVRADEGIMVWDTATGKNIVSIAIEQEGLQDAAFAPDCKTLATSASDYAEIDGRRILKGWVKTWDVATGKERLTLERRDGEVRSMAFSPDGKTLAVGGDDGSIKLWNAAKIKEPVVFEGPASAVTALAFRTDGKMLASGSADKTIRLWNVDAAK